MYIQDKNANFMTNEFVEKKVGEQISFSLRQNHILSKI